MTTDLAQYTDDQLREILTKLAEETQRIEAELNRRKSHSAWGALCTPLPVYVVVAKPTQASTWQTVYTLFLN